MSKTHPSSRISWTAAYWRGFLLSCHHMIFTLLAILAVTCERSLAFFQHYTGVSWQQVISDYKDLYLAFARNPFGGPVILTKFPALFQFLPVAMFLFVVSAFILIGILGLMRDLLRRQGYDTRDLVARGSTYFWPIVKFKAPIYLALSSLLVSAGPAVLALSREKAWFTLKAGILFGLLAIGFFLGRILLSLGPKMIVTEETKKVTPAYGAVLRMVRPFLAPVAFFYMAMIPLGLAPLALSIALSFVGAPFVLVTIASVFMMAFATVFIKGASFCLYLQLREVNSEVQGNR